MKTNFLSILKKFKSLFTLLFVIFVTPLVALLCLFLYTSCIGTISSKFAADLITTLAEKNIPDLKVKMHQIEISSSGMEINVTLHGLGITYAENTIMVPYIKADINPIEMLYHNSVVSGISDVNITSDISITRGLANHEPTKKKSNVTPKYIKKYLSDNPNIISMFTKIVNDAQLKISNSTKSEVKNLSVDDLNCALAANEKGMQNSVLICHGLFKFGDEQLNFSATADMSDDRNIIFNGKAEMVPVAILWSGTQYAQMVESSLKVDIAFNALFGTQGFDNFHFEITDHRGLIQSNDYVIRDIIFDNVSLSGRWTQNDGLIVNSVMKVNKINASAKAIYNKNGFTAEMSVGEITINSAFENWPKFANEELRDWLVANVKGGMIQSIKANLNVGPAFIWSDSNIPEDAINIVIELSDNNLTYMEGYNLEPLKIRSGSISITPSNVLISLKNANIAGLTTEDVVGRINYLAPHTYLDLKGNFRGKAQNAIDLAFLHAKIDNSIAINFQGDALVALNMMIPLDQEFEFTPNNIKIAAVLENISNKSFLDAMKVDHFKINCDLVGSDLNITGNGLIDTSVKTSFNIKKNIFENDGILIRIGLDASIADLKKSGKLKENWISGKFFGNLDVHIIDDAYSINGHANLTPLYFTHPIGMSKKFNEKGVLLFQINGSSKSDIIEIADYKLNIPMLSSSGKGFANKSGLISLSSHNQNNGGSFDVTYQKDYADAVELTVKGSLINAEKIDIPALVKLGSASNGENNNDFKLRIDCNKLVLHRQNTLLNAKISLDCKSGKCNNFRLNGNFFDGRKITVFYSYPVVSLVTDAASKTLLSFGLYDKMQGGKIEFKGSFQEKEIFRGRLILDDFYLKNAPTVAKLFAPLTSLKGMSDAWSNKGIYFHSMQADILYNEAKLFIDDLSMAGPFVNIKCVSAINTTTSKVSGEGVIIPYNIINRATTNIPVIGKLISGGDGLLATNFSLRGSVSDVSIAINPLSIMAPGFLGKFFDNMSSFRKNENFPIKPKK